MPRPSRRFRLTAAGAVAAALIGAGLAAVPSSAANAPYSTKDAFVTVHDGPDGKHTAVIDTRLYVPRDVNASHPAPAILMTHGFGLSKTATEVTATAGWLARHGYVVLTWTSQGFGKSSGCISLDSYAYDVKDVEQLIAKVLQPRHDIQRDRRGLVLGMTGGSYGGGITVNAASVDHRIRAIVAGRTWNDLAYALDPNNYVSPGDPTGFTHSRNVQGVFKKEWTSLFFADGNAAPAGGIPPNGQEQGGCPQEKADSGNPTTVAGLPCLGYPTAVCETYAHLAGTGDVDATDLGLVKGSSVSSHINSLDAATLLLQGQSDTLFNVNDALATYTALKRRDVPVAMTWNSGGHGGYNSKPGECDVFDVAPDGTATLIKRLIAPVRVPASAVAEPIRLQLLGFAHRFATGHSVRLVLAATDQSSYNSPVPDQITVRTGRGTTFSLPVDSPRHLFRGTS